MRKVAISVLVLVSFVMVAFLAYAQEEAEAPATEEATFEYVGPSKCKMCHKDVYAAWEKTSHATTYNEDLSAEEQKNPECNVCHITGMMEDGELIENVTCEACHGPGSAYKSPKIMSRKWNDDPAKYKAAAMEAGLVYPDEEFCTTKCHKKEGNPNFKPFDWERMAPLVHPVATEEAPE